jgi:hypothetical protein
MLRIGMAIGSCWRDGLTGKAGCYTAGEPVRASGARGNGTGLDIRVCSHLRRIFANHIMKSVQGGVRLFALDNDFIGTLAPTEGNCSTYLEWILFSLLQHSEIVLDVAGLYIQTFSISTSDD